MSKAIVAQVLNVKPDDLVTSVEAASILKIKRGSVLKAVERGRLHGTKVGPGPGAYYFTKEEVKRYGESRNENGHQGNDIVQQVQETSRYARQRRVSSVLSNIPWTTSTLARTG